MKKTFTLEELLSFIPEHQAINEYKIDDLIQHFNSEKFGTIIVSKNGSKYFIIDGAIRIKALKKMNYSLSKEIECEIK